MNHSLNEFLNQLSGAGNNALGDIGIPAFILLMSVSLVSSVLISGLYLYFYQHRATGSQIHRAFPLLGLSVTAIFICIQFSLPLSLGLLGALSIVRFRTPIKEPEEIGFIMLVIAASIACATFNLMFLLILLVIAVAAMTLFRFGPSLLKAPRKDGVVMVTLSDDEYRSKGADLMGLLSRTLGNARLEGVSQSAGQAVVSYSFMGLKEDSVPGLQEALRDRVELKDFNIYFHRPGAL